MMSYSHELTKQKLDDVKLQHEHVSLTCARKLVSRLSAVVAFDDKALRMLPSIIWFEHKLQLHLLLPAKGKGSRAYLERP